MKKVKQLFKNRRYGIAGAAVVLCLIFIGALAAFAVLDKHSKTLAASAEYVDTAYAKYISSEADFYDKLVNDINNGSTSSKTYYLTCDISLTKQEKFTKDFSGGTFDGQGNTINFTGCHYTYVNTGVTQYGLFPSVVSGTKIRNLYLTGTMTVTGGLTNTNTVYAGGIVGGANSITIENIYSTLTCSLQGASPNNYYAGGVLGYVNSSTKLWDIYVSSAVTLSGTNAAYCLGGIVGYVSSISDVKNVVFAGSVSGGGTRGTIFGYRNSNNGTLANVCAATGSGTVKIIGSGGVSPTGDKNVIAYSSADTGNVTSFYVTNDKSAFIAKAREWYTNSEGFAAFTAMYDGLPLPIGVMKLIPLVFSSSKAGGSLDGGIITINNSACLTDISIGHYYGNKYCIGSDISISVYSGHSMTVQPEFIPFQNFNKKFTGSYNTITVPAGISFSASGGGSCGFFASLADGAYIRTTYFDFHATVNAPANGSAGLLAGKTTGNITLNGLYVRFCGKLIVNTGAKAGLIAGEIGSASTINDCNVVVEGGEILPAVGASGYTVNWDIGNRTSAETYTCIIYFPYAYSETYDGIVERFEGIKGHCVVIARDDATLGYSVVYGSIGFKNLASDAFYAGFYNESIGNLDKKLTGTGWSYIYPGYGTVYSVYKYKDVTLYARRNNSVYGGVLATVPAKSGDTVEFSFGDSGLNVVSGYVFYGFEGVRGLDFSRVFDSSWSSYIIYADYITAPSVSVADKTYDGTAIDYTAGDLNGYSVGGVVYKNSLGETLDQAPVDAGNYTFSANFFYNTSVVGSISSSFEITKKTITVTPREGQMHEYSYGKTIDESELTYSHTALCGQDALSGVLGIKDNGDSTGKYEITAGTLDVPTDNYTLSFVSGVYYEIVNIIVTITPTGVLNKVYDGTNNVNITYTADKTVNLSGSLSIGDNKDAGTYQILAGTLTDPNCTVRVADTDFVILRKDVTVTPDSGQSKMYDKTLPDNITYTVSGLVAGDSLSGALSAQSVNAGNVLITQGTLTNANNKNYNIILKDVTYEVTKCAVTVTPDAGQSKQYDKQIPTVITYTSSCTLPSGDFFSGSLTVGDGTAVYDNYKAGEHQITIGTLSLNSNYDLTLANAVYTVKPRQITTVYFRAADKTVYYIPSSTVSNSVTPVVEGLLAGDTALPLFIYKRITSNGSEDVPEGTKLSAGTYEARTVNLLTDTGYEYNMTNPNYTLIGSYSTEYTVLPFVLKKEHFIFPDLTYDYTSYVINDYIATLDASKGYDFPDVRFVSSRYEDQLNQSSTLVGGKPMYAGTYRNSNTFSFGSNYTCEDIGSSATGTITISRNIVINKRLLTVRAYYEGKTAKSTGYLSKTITISASVYGNIGTEVIELKYRVEKNGSEAVLKNAGEYTIIYSFANSYYSQNYKLSDGIYYDEAVFRDSFTITKADPVIQNAKAADIYFESSLSVSGITASAQSVQGTALSYGRFEFENPNAVLNAGTHVVSFLYYPSAMDYEDTKAGVTYFENYNICRGLVSIKVLPQIVTVTPVAGQSQEYNGKLDIIKYTASNIADSSRYQFAGQLGVTRTVGGVANTAIRTVGDYTVTIGTLRVVFNDKGEISDTPNYVILFTQNVKYTIAPKKVSVSFDGFDNLVYSDDPADSMAIGASVQGVELSDNPENLLQLVLSFYKLNSLSIWTQVQVNLNPGHRVMLDAGYYRVTAAVNGANYLIDPLTQETGFYVERRNLSKDLIKFVNTEFSYNGTVRALEADLSLFPKDITVSYKKNANINTGVHEVEVYFNANTANYYLDSKIIDAKTSYLYKQTITINKFLIQNISVENADNLVYNGKAQTIKVLFEGVRSEDNVQKTISITQNGMPAVPMNAGVYNLSVMIGSNPNYEFAPGCLTEITFEIKRTELSVIPLLTLIKAYNGQTGIEILPSDLELIGIIPGDEVFVATGFSADFEDENVGAEKRIIFKNFMLGGASAGNYSVNWTLSAISGQIIAKQYLNTSDNGLDFIIQPITNSNLPLEARVVTTVLKSDEYNDLNKSLLKQKLSVFKMFSFEILKDGQPLELDAAVLAKISAEGGSFKLYRLNDDGTYEEVEFIIKDGYLEFEVSYFGTYFLAAERAYQNIFAQVFTSPVFYAVTVPLIAGFAAYFIIRHKRRVKDKGGNI